MILIMRSQSIYSPKLFFILAVYWILNGHASIVAAEELRAHPAAIIFNAKEGRSAGYTRSIFITTTNGEIINWNVSAGESWITTDRSGGSTDAVVKVVVNTSGLSTGTYNGNISVSSPESTTGPIDIEVTLVINPDVPVTVTPWKDGKDGAMSVSVDDSQGSGFDALEANGFSGTYVLEGLSIPSFYDDYFYAGMELGCHTVHHNCFSVLDDVLRYDEIEPNIDALCSGTPQPCKDIISLVWPCGYTNFREQTIAAEYFLSARGYNINQMEDAYPENMMNLKSYNSHEHYPYPPSDFKNLVDLAVSQKKWFNLVLHDYSNDDGATAYSASKNIWVSSIGSVVKYMMQRDRFIISNYDVTYNKITYKASRLPIPSSPVRSFDNAIGSSDVITMQIDIDDSKTVENVFINGVANAYQVKSINGNQYVLTNVKLETSSAKTVEIKYVFTAIGLTVTGVTANNKVYNGTTSATINTSGAALVGVLEGDNVALVTTGARGVFTNKNVGNGKLVTTSGFALTGIDAEKYAVIQPTALADITKADLSITGVTANNRVYNATVTATLNTGSASLSGVMSGDAVSLVSSGASGTFNNKNIGTGKPVTISGFSITGTDAGNYNLIIPYLTASITAASLSITGVTAENKIYDGSNNATLNTDNAALTGVISGDVVNLIKSGASGTFDNEYSGTAKTVYTSGFAIDGSDAGNYALIQPTTTADIIGLPVSVTGVVANSKIYNRTTSATLNSSSAELIGVIPGDDVTLVSTGATGTFDNKNVGTDKTVTTSGFTLGGSDARKYSISQPLTTGNITPATLTISGVTVNTKVYNGDASAVLNTGSAVLSGVYGSDNVILISSGATGTFADKNAGTTKPVNITGFTIGGTDSGNYNLTQPTATGNINPAPLTVNGITANNRVYNRTTAATLNTESASLSGVLAGDIVTLISSGASATFANKNAGNGKTVSTSGFTLSGANASNYTAIQPVTTANITPASLSMTGVIANNKVYNGSTAATLNSSSALLSGVFSGDLVSIVSSGASGIFATKTVGTGILVTISGYTLGGTDASNYTLTQPSATADITAANLTVTGVTANNKVFDGTTTATLNIGSAALAGVYGADAVTLGSSGVSGYFEDEMVGTNKRVNISGFTISGADATNYRLTQPIATANITGILLTVNGVTANNRIYNGTVSATLNTGSATLSGIINGHNVTLVTSGAIGTFANKNVGTSKTVTTTGFSLSGTDANKYTVVQPVVTASITASGLTVSGVIANNRAYNGTTSATLNTGNAALVRLFGSDAVSLVSSGATGTFSNKNAGTGKTVTTTGFTLSGTDAGNYTLAQPATTGNITVASLTISGVTASNKVYDGTTSVSINTASASLNGRYAGDVVNLISIGATGAFSNKNAGTGKTVLTNGFTISGADAANYTVVQPTLTANITPFAITVNGVTANNKIYDGNTSTSLNRGSATLSGVLGGDAVNLSFSGAIGIFASKDVGTSKQVTASGITLTGPDAGNYTLIQPLMEADITSAILTISSLRVNDKIYDGTTAATLNTDRVRLEGVYDSDNVTLVTSFASGIFTSKEVGRSKPVTISGFTISGSDAGNYVLVQPTANADITERNLTITANDLYKAYKTTLTFNGTEYTIQGLIAGDIPPVVTISSQGAQGSALPGLYEITVSGGQINNYHTTYVNGILSVGKQMITATADSKSKYYGDGNPDLTITYTGLIDGDDPSVLDITPVASTEALENSPSGSYQITLSEGFDNKYLIKLVNGTLEILKAPLNITADNKTKVYGDPNPVLTFSYSGFVTGQDESVLDVLPFIQTEADDNSDAGIYDIKISGAEDDNYSFIYKYGILEILKADQSVTFDEIPSKLRMTEEVQLNAASSSGLPIEFEFSDPAKGSLNGSILTLTGDGKLIITPVQEGNKNWNPATGEAQTIEILPTFDNISSLFTPNGDGMNDYWYIPDLEQFGKTEVTVYNRFGQAVYKSVGYKNDWDGTWNGHPLPSASYYYIIRSSEKGFLKGVVNIVR